MSEQQAVLHAFKPEERTRFNGRGLARRSTAPLDRLPERLVFPDGLRDRVSFDPERHELVYTGYMSSAEHFFLQECSDDPDYLRAVNELHHMAAFEPVGPPKLVPTWLWALVGTSFAVTALRD